MLVVPLRLVVFYVEANRFLDLVGAGPLHEVMNKGLVSFSLENGDIVNESNNLFKFASGLINAVLRMLNCWISFVYLHEHQRLHHSEG
jgi:hypothetical protein